MPKFVLIFSVPENERGNVKGQIELETLQVRFTRFRLGVPQGMSITSNQNICLLRDAVIYVLAEFVR